LRVEPKWCKDLGSIPSTKKEKEKERKEEGRKAEREGGRKKRKGKRREEPGTGGSHL
jgi:hypothetical protein